jgi:DNA-binding Lrp family transcriptional regulator
MKLTPKEKEVFALTRTQADKSAQEIARLGSVQAGTVRRCLDRLFDKGVFRRRSIIADVSRLGYTLYRMFVSFTGASTEELLAFRTFVIEHEQVSMFSEVGGQYQFDIQFISCGPNDVAHFTRSLNNKLKGTLRIHSLGITTGFTLFGNTEWQEGTSAAPSIHFEAAGGELVLDELDKKVLSGLASENFRTPQELGRKLGIPLSTLNYRIKKLEQEKVIIGHYYVYDTNKAGLLPFTLLIETRGTDKSIVKKLTSFCESRGFTNTLEWMIADYSAVVNVTFKAYEDAASLSNSLYATFDKDILSIRLLPQLRFLKYSAYPLNVG